MIMIRKIYLVKMNTFIGSLQHIIWAINHEILTIASNFIC